jgi:hypothetical protein
MGWKVLSLSFFLLQAGAGSPFQGDGVSGGGRACNGDLRIFPRYLNWETSFSTCDHVTYQPLPGGDGKSTWVYQLRARPKACRFEVLEVRHDADNSGAWEVTGFQSLAAWRKSDKMQVSNCPMY